MRPEQFGPERLDLSSSTGLTAEGLMAEGSRSPQDLVLSEKSTGFSVKHYVIVFANRSTKEVYVGSIY
jgi:hypothetical protein